MRALAATACPDSCTRDVDVEGVGLWCFMLLFQAVIEPGGDKDIPALVDYLKLPENQSLRISIQGHVNFGQLDKDAEKLSNVRVGVGVGVLVWVWVWVWVCWCGCGCAAALAWLCVATVAVGSMAAVVGKPCPSTPCVTRTGASHDCLAPGMDGTQCGRIRASVLPVARPLQRSQCESQLHG